MSRTVGYGHGDVTVPFQNLRAATFGPSASALEGRTFVDHDRGNFQFIDIGAFVVLRVGNRGKQNLLDDVSGLLVAERQQLLGLFHRQTADLVGNQAYLLR